jgi:D-amino-acid dehydrogenase
MEQGLRLTTGVELTHRDAPANSAQLDIVEKSARDAIDLGKPVEKTAWIGSRPTLPDSRPAIGEAPGHKGLFLAFGHQHIGFGTGTGTAKVLADLMEGRPPPIDPKPFAPGRF